MVGRTFGYEPFAGFELKREYVAAALLALALCSLWRLAVQPQLFAFAPGKELVEGI